MTNLVFIRTATEAELVKYFGESLYCPDSRGDCTKSNITCRECWLQWLNEEREGAE